MNIKTFDGDLIHFFRRVSIPMARFGLFIVFFWFGILKVLDLSPATPLVEKLFTHTVPVMSFGTFIIFFGLLEMVIGIFFLIKGMERIVIPLLLLHMVTTFLPLFILPQVTWTGFLIPTLEGQYIIKNFVIIACAIGIAAQLHPLKKIQ